MTSFTMIVIMGVLMILGGISLMATPLMTFVSAGYFIIALFFLAGVVGIIRGISEKNYGKEFLFAILSLILGIIGCVVPGAAAMNNSIMLYMAAAWFFIHGVLSIVNAFRSKKEGATTGFVVIGVLLGVLELALGVYSVAHPAILAVSLGLLIGFYFIESGVNAIVAGSMLLQGGNNVTVLYTVMGVLTIIGGISMLATPLLTFLTTGYTIVILFFLIGVLGIIRAITEKRYEKEFFFALLSLVMGIIGLTVPGVAAMNNSVLLFMAAAWFFIHGILSIVRGIESKKAGAETGVMVIGIVLGVLEILLGVYSVAHPSVLAISVGILISLYFIETGINLIFIGSAVSRVVAAERELKAIKARNYVK